MPFKIFTTIFKSKVQVKTTAISVLTSFSPSSHAIPCLLRLNADLGTQQLYPKKGEQRGLDRGREGGLVGGKKERDMCEQLGQKERQTDGGLMNGNEMRYGRTQHALFSRKGGGGHDTLYI